MELVRTEVAALEAQERIKKIDAAFTWPHPTDKGYFTTAVFVRTDEDKPYLIYCPRATTSISIDKENYDHYLLWRGESYTIREVRLNQSLTKEGDILLYIIPLGSKSESKVKKADIEKMFGIKVVD